jgi:hypothetical protein
MPKSRITLEEKMKNSSCEVCGSTDIDWTRELNADPREVSLCRLHYNEEDEDV